MQNLLIIILLLIVFSIIPVLRTDLFAIYILQLKEYRIDRLKEFFRSPEGKRAFFNKYLIVYGVIFGIYALSYWLFANSFFRVISWILIGILALDSLFHLYKIWKHSLLIPKITQRSILLISGVLAIQVAIFIVGYFCRHFFLAMGVLLVLPYLIVALVNLLMLPMIEYKKQKFMKRAELKIKELDITAIGVTGSFGKSSVKLLLLQILKNYFKTLGTPENINTEMGVSEVILNKLNKDYEVFVAEMGAYKEGEIALLGRIVNHKHGFVTGIGNQHIGLFGSQEKIRRAKFEIANSVKKNAGNLYVNIDSVKHIGHDVIAYSIENSEADAYSEIKSCTDSCEFVFHYDDKKWDLETNLSSKHQILNLTGVLACCYDMGIDIGKLEKILLDLEQPKATLQVQKLKSGLQIIDDAYNLSFDGLKAGLDLLKQFDGKKYLVLDDVIELGKYSAKTHREIGELVAEYDLDRVFLIGKNYKKFVIQGLKKSNFPEQKILDANQINIIHSFTEGTVLFEGRGAGKYISINR